jgi:hypothetical protein
MKSLILGIVGVLILQSAFVALTTSDNAREVAVKDLASELGSDPLPGLIAVKETAPDLSTPVFVDEIAAFEEPARRNPRSRPMTATPRFTEMVAQSEPLPESRSNDSIIILYGRRPDTTDAGVAKERPRTESRSLLAKEEPHIPTEEPRTQSKSFIAKAAPIIQKPYNWLKAVASKLK